MEWVEATGRSVTEAKNAALDLLGVAGDEADFEVLAEEEKGLFGRVKQEARVRARVRPAQPRPKAEGGGRRNDRKRNRNRGGGGGDRSKARSGGGDRERSKGRDSGEREQRRQQQREQRREQREQDREQPKRERQAARAGREESAEDSAPVAASVGAAAAPTPRSAPAEGDVVSLDAQAEIVSEFMSGLSDAFGLAGEVTTITVDEETREIQLNGDDLGLLIGPRGHTLRCVQDLARTVVQRQGDREPGRVRIDVAMYYAERRASLERFTRELAQKVIDSGEELALEPMRAADRKIVHDTVGEIDGVDTISEGSDPDRRVVLIPVD
ncbi:MAG: KH domain-containing protein [Acidimicrobiales bacterium]|nr:KH domain-containing protein [Acidimicrobiales bacterium]